MLPVLKAHNWPGNVRELSDLIEREALSCKRKTIRMGALPNALRAMGRATPAVENDHPLALEAQQRRHIIQVLVKARRNQVKATRLLNIAHDPLRYRIRKYHVPK